jgi:uncharacterized protein Yka (UPF0111/DUF47 family)
MVLGPDFVTTQRTERETKPKPPGHHQSMPSLQKLLGHEDKFFDLLEGSVAEARSSVQALRKMLEHVGGAQDLTEFAQARRRNKLIAAEISENLCTTFVTSMEREDIEALSNTLYKIPKNIEKIAERVALAPRLLTGVNLAPQSDFLDRAITALAAMIRDVRRGLSWQEVKYHNDQLQAIEGDADKVVLELLRGLYTEQQEAGRAIFLKDLFELFEKSIDRCRDAGNILSHIVLKNT